MADTRIIVTVKQFNVDRMVVYVALLDDGDMLDVFMHYQTEMPKITCYDLMGLQVHQAYDFIKQKKMGLRIVGGVVRSDTIKR